MPAEPVDKRRAAREVIDILEEMASLLNVDLGRQELSYCVSMIENGANPETLATVIKDIRARFPAEEESEEGMSGESGE